MRRITILILVLISLGLAACSVDQPQISLETSKVDLGDVVNGEVVTREVTVRNTGAVTLIVEGVSTSCGCTKATLDPMTIPPDSSSILHIEFDSGAHGPEENGQIVRQIFISSNDPLNSEVMLELASNVLPAASTP